MAFPKRIGTMGELVCAGCDEEEERKPSVHINIDASTAKDVLGMKLDQEVEVTVKGKLQSTEMRKGKEDWQNGGHINVELGSVKVKSVGQFDDMLEED